MKAARLQLHRTGERLDLAFIAGATVADQPYRRGCHVGGLIGVRVRLGIVHAGIVKPEQRGVAPMKASCPLPGLAAPALFPLSRVLATSS
jgi:hypothetical protein